MSVLQMPAFRRRTRHSRPLTTGFGWSSIRSSLSNTRAFIKSASFVVLVLWGHSGERTSPRYKLGPESRLLAPVSIARYLEQYENFVLVFGGAGAPAHA